MSPHRHHVVIAGGGVAAIEALLALGDLAGHRVSITVVSPEREFVYRPVTVAEAFDRAQARVYPWGEILEEGGGGRLVWDAVDAVVPDERIVCTATGERIGYDTLIVAAGARPVEALAGALTFRGRPDVPALRDLLDALAGGKVGSLALTLPAPAMWPLPIYELALLTASRLRESGSGAELWLITPERSPLELFGPAAAQAVAPMLQARGIRLRTSARAVLVRSGRLILSDGSAVEVDRVLSLPRLEGPRLPGLPHDPDGFIPTDGHGRVAGVAGVYAAGDVTSFPLKQGGLAAQQADAVAESVAAELGVPVSPTPFNPVLRGLLITEGAPLYLRAEPQRLSERACVAVDATVDRGAARRESAAGDQPLWWPPAKIAGRYLGPFLATARPRPLASELLVDRVAAPGPALSQDEHEEVLDLALLLADCDARWGDYEAALSALDAAQALEGALPPEYEDKRREWRAAARVA